MVEFVSANPTGPMHMGNARGGVLGDTLAAVLAKSGAEVWREFYVNDAGNQIDKFAKSLEARYLQIIHGEDAIAFPEDGYQGDDIRELAKKFYELHGEAFVNADEQARHDALAQFGLQHNIPKMKSDLERYGIHYDEWFFESSLHNSGYVADTVEELSKRGYTYEKDGALWLKTADAEGDLTTLTGDAFTAKYGKVVFDTYIDGVMVAKDSPLLTENQQKTISTSKNGTATGLATDFKISYLRFTSGGGNYEGTKDSYDGNPILRLDAVKVYSSNIYLEKAE